jgi:hypothetical protein
LKLFLLLLRLIPNPLSRLLLLLLLLLILLLHITINPL